MFFLNNVLPYFLSDSYPTIHDKSRASNNPYPPFFNLIPPTNYSLPPPIHMASNQSTKRSIPSKINKRPRLTAYIRREILKLKATHPMIFISEIQQNLLQNGICNSQTVPNVSLI